MNQIASLMLTASLIVQAQSFEVASVRQRDPNSSPMMSCSGGPSSSDPLHYRCRNATIAYLAQIAYRLAIQEIDIPDADAWMGNTYSGFDIEVLLPAGATNDEFRVMVQNLLTERFHMKWHRETIQEEVYILTAPNPTMKKSNPGTPTSFKTGNIFQRDGPIQFSTQAMGMQTFADMLVPMLGKRVTNNTHLDGTFDFELEFVSPASLQLVDGPSVFTAFRALGLELKASKQPISVFKIDSADKVPTPN